MSVPALLLYTYDVAICHGRVVSLENRKMYMVNHRSGLNS